METLAVIRDAFSGKVSIYRVFNESFSKIKEAVSALGWRGFFKAIWKDFAHKAEEDLANSFINYDPLSTSPNESMVFGAYTSSYFMGYGTEQAVSITLLALTGTEALKIGAKVLEVLNQWKAGEKVIKLITHLPAHAKRVKTAVLGYIVRNAGETVTQAFLVGLEGLDVARAAITGTARAAERPFAVLGRILNTIDSANPGFVGTQRLLEGLGKKVGTNQSLFNVWKASASAAGAANGVEAMKNYIKGAAVTAEKMEAAMHDGAALDGLATHYPRLDTPGHFNTLGMGTRVEDLHVALKADTAAGAQCMEKTLANAYNNPLPDGRLKVIDLHTVHPTLYMYAPSTAFLFVNKGTKTMKSFPDGHFFTPSIFTNSTAAKNGLQLPKKIPPISDVERARYRFEVETADIADDLHIPVGKDLDHPGGAKPRDSSEPIVSDNKGYGGGGHPQFTTGKEFKIKNVYDTVLGRVLDVSEWP